MEKHFDKWNDTKKVIHIKHGPFYHQREIWWCSLGVNVGFEEDGTGDEFRRPVLVLKGLSAQTCLVIPLTTSTQSHDLRIPIGFVNGREARAILSQIRVIDTRRLVRKIGHLDRKIFEVIRKTIKDML